MRIGTKSVLFGAHAFWLHPWFVAAAWWRLYGFPWDPRLWAAFFVHDLGYVGKPNMDGEEGEKHVLWGAYVMGAIGGTKWYLFTMYHSRFWVDSANRNAIRQQLEPAFYASRLCYADKAAIAMTPAWLYVPMTRLTGEIREYRAAAKHRAELDSPQEDTSFAADWRWFKRLQDHMWTWASDGAS